MSNKDITILGIFLGLLPFLMCGMAGLMDMIFPVGGQFEYQEYHWIIRPVWHNEERVPKDLLYVEGKTMKAPAILINRYSDEGLELLEILGIDRPGQYSVSKIENWGDRLMAWGNKHDAYVWIHLYYKDDLVGSHWWEALHSRWAKETLRRWFTEADMIIVEQAIAKT